MVDELHQSLLAARYVGGPLALTRPAPSLEMGTMGGAGASVGRRAGLLEVGKLADLAVWRVDGLAGAGIEDPVCTLVLGAAQLERLYVGGREVVVDGELQTADASKLAVSGRHATSRETLMDFLFAARGPRRWPPRRRDPRRCRSAAAPT